MSVLQPPAPPAATEPAAGSGAWRRRGGRTTLPAAAVVARGEPVLWLTAGALAVALFMIAGLLALVIAMGGRTFWPGRLERVELRDGRTLMGEVAGRETYTLSRSRLGALPEASRAAAAELLGDRSEAEVPRTLLRVDNKQLTGESYVWVSDFERKPDGTTRPEWAVAIERTTWGRFVGLPASFTVLRPREPSGVEEQLVAVAAFFDENAGRLDEATQAKVAPALERLRSDLAGVRRTTTETFLKELPAGGGSARVALLESGEEVPLERRPPGRPVTAVRETWTGPEASWERFEAAFPATQDRAAEHRRLDVEDLGAVNHDLREVRLDVIEAGLDLDAPLLPAAEKLAELDAARDALADAAAARGQILAAIARRRTGGNAPLAAAARTIADALEAEAAAEAGRLDAAVAEAEKTVSEDGRAAVEEYRAVASEARRVTADVTVRMARIQAENDRYEWGLETADGTPQTLKVADVVRAYPANRLDFWGRTGVYFSRWAEFLTDDPREANTEGGVFPAIWGTVAMTLIMTVAVVPFGVLAALFLREYAKAGPVVSAVRIAVNNLAGVPSIVFGVFGLGFFCYLIGGGIDDLFFRAAKTYDNQPTFGTGGLLWASLTLALLTLPVVIVATEEALAAVPGSMREGSYACGASKWQTIRRIVLPRALPGIMTGMILAMARGAGEVAPLMLVGAVKLAPELPVDAEAPFLHPSRSFMHLGFHIYDVGFQSPDSDAARPMVYTTTLLLIAIVAGLNVTAIWLRSRLRRRFSASQF